MPPRRGGGSTAMTDHDSKDSRREDRRGFATRAVHGGELADCSAFPIYQANSAQGGYSRHGNPTVRSLEEKFQALEGGGKSLGMACGMAAASFSLLALLSQGDRIVAHRHLFSGVQGLFEHFLPNYGFRLERIDMLRIEELERALVTPARIVYVETVSNRHLEIFDVPRIVKTAHRAGALVVVDNTFFTPYLFRPLELGADLVVHSASKYVCGHGDALGGFVTAGDPQIGRRLDDARRILGGIMSPVNAHFLARGLKTLGMRMERHGVNAGHVAAALEGRAGIERVLYPGLPSFEGHELAASFSDGFGGVLLVDLEREIDWRSFRSGLRICRDRFSYGEPTTLVHQLEARRFRIAAGLEDADDIVEDLERGLTAAWGA